MSYQDSSSNGYSRYPPPPVEEEDRNIPPYGHHRAPSNSGGVTLPPISPYAPAPLITSPYHPQQSTAPTSPYHPPQHSTAPSYSQTTPAYVPQPSVYPQYQSGYQDQPQYAQQPQQHQPNYNTGVNGLQQAGHTQQHMGHSQQHMGPVQPHMAPTQQHAGNAQQYMAPNQQHMGNAQQPTGNGQQAPFPQSAPRQRTAIACRYCRRRKIRCSGFDQNPDGRCSNCCRFQQVCIFTPVSSQAQAFVPAHSRYPNLRLDEDGRPIYTADGGQGYGSEPPPLYGAHGQPLGRVPQAAFDRAAPSPTGSFSSMNDTPPTSARAPGLMPGPYGGHDPGPSHSQELPPHPRQDHDPRARPSPPYYANQYGPPSRSHIPYTPQERAQDRGQSSVSPTGSESSRKRRRANEESLPVRSGPPPASADPAYARSNSGNRRSPARPDPMSLGSIIDRQPNSDIDQTMLNKFNGKGKQK